MAPTITSFTIQPSLPSNPKPPLACRMTLSLSRSRSPAQPSPTHDHHNFLIHAVRLMACKPTRLRILFSATSHRCCQTRNSVVNLGLRTETLSSLDSFQGERGTCHVSP
ncbi:hypothetical protein FOIG_04056 [Fusarium odoratissimum NRRL 54006]|uniref:Uncharacterized protein n=2 Tax=Fusarium oxysporum species complex TaxID=171631 RepID=X0KA14_FUSO5|nr:uncharacterized protein FOIG_04056 [Fusarium odoratissimum NRRL 54006]XP_031067570.1 uncharacterized protein FOIG_04056 [Fusarium odoratissimum NRRL 54006]EXM05480.1 hypothetical protein FOIG_04056 [Fusarium odoratissimum NRRL 54006]EXM05481.1 hypothetical protein FOIG_04056 [Fusarium odoratissimum NRRL 54006]TXB99984.1 hypothetical protein FocTR4_00014375 [Fusarium oxysporum f. sp. cubense]